MSRNRRSTNRAAQPGTQQNAAPPALAEVLELRVADLGPQHLGCRIEVRDRYDGMVGPAAGTLVGYRPSENPPGYMPGGSPWRMLLLAQGPGKGEAPVVREVDLVRVVSQ